MTTAEALAQIRDALRAKYWLLQRPEDVEQAFAEALATLDYLEAEIERLQAAAEPVIPGYGSSI